MKSIFHFDTCREPLIERIEKTGKDSFTCSICGKGASIMHSDSLNEEDKKIFEELNNNENNS